MPVVKQSLSTIATDPLRNFKYQVNIPKKPLSGVADSKSMISMGFMNMSGLSAATDVIPYREGGDNTTPRKMPGQTQFGDVTLMRGVIPGTWQSWYWLRELFQVNSGGPNGAQVGNNFRVNIDVLVLKHPVTAGNTPAAMKFRLYNCWPSSLAYSELDAGSNAVYVEQMTLVHEGFDIKWASGPGTSDVTNSSFPL